MRKPGEKPNIIFIMIDDMGKEWIICYGGEEMRTPNIDKLAAGGMRFKSAYSMARCTPTRATLLTGQYPWRHGWVNHWDVPRWGAGCHFDWRHNASFARVMRHGELRLVLVARHPGDAKQKLVPGYDFEMRQVGSGGKMGGIRLQVGSARTLRCPGHIGFGVEPDFRGNHYAARSVLLILPFTRANGIKVVWATCKPGNAASRRTLEIAGLKSLFENPRRSPDGGILPTRAGAERDITGFAPGLLEPPQANDGPSRLSLSGFGAFRRS